MVPFYNECPELADSETRSIMIMNDKHLPNGTYGLLEFYCDDLDCDCRRVTINVYCPEITKRKMLATISFGWESLKFYQKNSPFIKDPKLLKGPCLDMMNKQSKYAPYLLKIVEQVLEDQEYVDRLKRHYNLFKQSIKRKKTSEKTVINASGKKTSRNAPCPCGSGKKYKKCCGR